MHATYDIAVAVRTIKHAVPLMRHCTVGNVWLTAAEGSTLVHLTTAEATESRSDA